MSRPERAAPLERATSRPRRAAPGNWRNVSMSASRRLTVALFATAALAALALPASAQTKLKWAHVYETSEPFHTQSVWAAEEIANRTGNRYQIDVYPAS